MCLASSHLSDGIVFFFLWACDTPLLADLSGGTWQLLRKALPGKLQKTQTDLWDMVKWIVRTNQSRKWDSDVLRMSCVFFVIMLNCFTSWSPDKNFLGPDLFQSLFLEVLPQPRAILEGNQSKKSRSYFPLKRMWSEITHCVEQKALHPCANTVWTQKPVSSPCKHRALKAANRATRCQLR